MLKTLRSLLLVLTVFWSMALLPTHALAQATLTCDEGVPVDGTHLYYTGENNDEGFCEFGGLEHILSQVVCSFVVMINSVLGKVYCGMQYILSDLVGMLFTLYIAVYGVMMLMGTAQLNSKDFMVRLLKIAAVWVFVTESAWAIGLAFNFFFLLASDGVYWVMSAIGASGGLDIFDPESFCYDEEALAASGFMSAFIRLDYILCYAVAGPFLAADNKVIGFFLVMLAVIPPITILAGYWLLLNLSVLVRGLITFILGVSALAFLIAMAPIFLSMMLFAATYRFFETWIRYLISFSLQIVIVFAVIALWLIATLYFVNFFNELSNVIYSYKSAQVESNKQVEVNEWGVCPFWYEDNVANLGPYVECIGYDPENETWAPDEVYPIPSLLMPENPPETPICTMPDGTNDCTRFFYYLIYHLVTLIIVCYAFEALMRQAPIIAVYLAGPEYTPMLAQGFNVNRYGQMRALSSSTSQYGANKMRLGGGGSGKGGGNEPPQASGKATETYRDNLSRVLNRPNP